MSCKRRYEKPGFFKPFDGKRDSGIIGNAIYYNSAFTLNVDIQGKGRDTASFLQQRKLPASASKTPQIRKLNYAVIIQLPHDKHYSAITTSAVKVMVAE